MKTYVFEIDDSDGFDSTQVIEGARSEIDARRLAMLRHASERGITPGAAPYMWPTLAEIIEEHA